MVHAGVMRRDAVLIYGNYRAGQRSRCLYRRPNASNCGDGLVVVPVFAFKLIELLGKRFVRRQQFAQPYERAHHMHTHLNRSGAVQDIGRLYGAVLGEGKWWESRISMLGGSGRNLRPVENLNFGSREPKYEIRGKSSGIPFDGLVQAFGRYAIESSEISIEDDALAA